jgi:hypothetical protein
VNEFVWLVLGLVNLALSLAGLWFAVSGQWVKGSICLALLVVLFVGLYVAEKAGWIPNQEAERRQARIENQRRPGESILRYVVRQLLRNIG